MKEYKEPKYTLLTEELLKEMVKDVLFPKQNPVKHKLTVYALSENSMKQFDNAMKEYIEKYVKTLPTCGEAYDKQNQLDEDNLLDK